MPNKSRELEYMSFKVDALNIREQLELSIYIIHE